MGKWGDSRDHQIFPSEDVVSDTVETCRRFQYRCGLIKAINVLSGDRSTITLYLDGFPNVFLDVGNTQFEFDLQLKDGPVVEIVFQGYCTRRGEMPLGRADIFATLIFKDHDQMRKFVMATTATPDPGQKEYRSSDYGSRGLSLWPLV